MLKGVYQFLGKGDISKVKTAPGAEYLCKARQVCSKNAHMDIEKDLEEFNGKSKRLGPFEEGGIWHVGI